MEKKVNSIPLDELQRKLKQKFPELSEDDLHANHTGKKDMIQLIGYKLRKTKDEMIHIIQFL